MLSRFLGLIYFTSGKLSSRVIYILMENSVPAAVNDSLVDAISEEPYEVEEVFLTIRTNVMRLTGSLAFDAQAAMSRRNGEVNVIMI